MSTPSIKDNNNYISSNYGKKLRSQQFDDLVNNEESIVWEAMKHIHRHQT